MSICVVIKGPSYEEAHQQIQQALPYADLVELRLDYFSNLDVTELEKLKNALSIPQIFTLRSASQGGKYPFSEEERQKALWRLAALQPAYMDLESELPPSFIEEITIAHPDIKWILSYHNFENTPQDLDALGREIQQQSAALYKIAVTARSILDALRLLCWAKGQNNVIAISMGLDGQISRIIGPVLGLPITYASLDDEQQTAPGQLHAKVLKETYRYHKLSTDTHLFGLMGYPVDKSISDTTHNLLFNALDMNAQYIKMRVQPHEVKDFFELIKQLPFRGLSVTMPLKEIVVPHIDYVDPQAQEIGAVNTISIENGNLSGFNTDGWGALNALEEAIPVQGKRIVILGAGGAAKAIAYDAHRRGGLLTILNRDVKKAQDLAHQVEGIGKGLDQMADCHKEGYDILINTTPVPLPIDPSLVLPSAVVMDIKTRPRDTELLKEAQALGCRIVYGYRMFVEQALGQYKIWFKNKIDVDICRRVLEQKSLEAINLLQNGINNDKTN